MKGDDLLAQRRLNRGPSFVAIIASIRVLGVQSQVVPATNADVRLWAELEKGDRFEGGSTIGKATSPIVRLGCTPERPPDLHKALEAIANADLIVARQLRSPFCHGWPDYGVGNLTGVSCEEGGSKPQQPWPKQISWAPLGVMHASTNGLDAQILQPLGQGFAQLHSDAEGIGEEESALSNSESSLDSSETSRAFSIVGLRPTSSTAERLRSSVARFPASIRSH